MPGRQGFKRRAFGHRAPAVPLHTDHPAAKAQATRRKNAAAGAATAREGAIFEDDISGSNAVYRARSLGLVKRQYPATRGRGGSIYRCDDPEGAGIDFLGHLHGVPIAFDAKNTHGPTLNLLATARGSERDTIRLLAQLAFLRDFGRSPRALAFLFVREPEHRIAYIVHGDAVLATLLAGRAVKLREDIRGKDAPLKPLFPAVRLASLAAIASGQPAWDYLPVLRETFPDTFDLPASRGPYLPPTPKPSPR